MTNDELVAGIEKIRKMMISVATGGPRIDAVNGEYQETFTEVAAELARRGISNPVNYNSLWDWYGRWSSGDLPSYQSRRQFVGDLLNPLINRILLICAPRSKSLLIFFWLSKTISVSSQRYS